MRKYADAAIGGSYEHSLKYGGDMKALTVKQPWAELIVSGAKDIENRTWRTNYRGRVYIHSSASAIPGYYRDLLPKEFWTSLSEPEKTAFIQSVGVRGAIIGEVDIVDCVINHKSIWAEKMIVDFCPDSRVSILRRGQTYIWNWVLANPVKYEQPITDVKGALSLWEYQPGAAFNALKASVTSMGETAKSINDALKALRKIKEGGAT